MRPENSRQFYLPPSIDAPDQPAAMAHSAPAVHGRPPKLERILQRTTYILVSLAAMVYICQTLTAGLAAVFHRPAGNGAAAEISEPATVVKPPPPTAPPATDPTKPKGETIFGPLPRTR